MATHPPFVPRAGQAPQAGLPRQRNRRSELAIWWREIDRVMLGLVLLLMALGTLAVAAGSPASAQRLSTARVKLDDLHFFYLHLRWQLVGLLAMFGAALLPKDTARRFGIVLGAAMLLGLFLVPIVGSTVNGAKRWLNLGFSLQPSEFLKPAFAICLAWILSWRARDPKLPVLRLSAAVMLLVVGLLMLQPDLGSAILFAGVWLVMVLLAGIPMQRIGIMAALGVGMIAATYLFYDNARHRIDAFLGGVDEAYFAAMFRRPRSHSVGGLEEPVKLLLQVTRALRTHCNPFPDGLRPLLCIHRTFCFHHLLPCL